MRILKPLKFFGKAELCQTAIVPFYGRPSRLPRYVRRRFLGFALSWLPRLVQSAELDDVVDISRAAGPGFQCD